MKFVVKTNFKAILFIWLSMLINKSQNMAVDNEVYKYTDKDGKKHEVAMVRVSSLDQIQRGDHICFRRTGYSHHAIVEDIEKSTGKINVIEFSNTARQSIEDNSIPPKTNVLARVVRGRYNLQEDTMYVIKHEKCLDPDTVVSRAVESLGRDDYHLFNNNCEHFALWCKTGISSSEQINNAKEAIKVGVIGVAAKGLENTVSKSGKEIFKIGISRVVTKEVVIQTVSNTGQQIVKSGVRAVTKEIVVQTASNTGQEMVKTGVRLATKEVVAQTASNAGQEVVKTGVRLATKEVVVQTASNTGQEMVKTGVRLATKEVVVQTASNTGQEVVKTGVRVATKEVVVQTASKTGQEVVKTGVRVTTEEVVTQTASKAGREVYRESVTGSGLLCAAAVETLFVAWDISCAYADMKAGKISNEELKKATGKRIVTGTINAAASSTGAAIGQILIPVPVLGGVVGGIVGSSLGKFLGSLLPE